MERCLSQIFHARRLGFETLEPEAAIAAEAERLASGDPLHLQKHSYQARSRYLEQLDRYERLFGRRQLLVLRSEDLFSEPERSWRQLLRFLKLPWHPYRIHSTPTAAVRPRRWPPPAGAAQDPQPPPQACEALRVRLGLGLIGVVDASVSAIARPRTRNQREP